MHVRRLRVLSRQLHPCSCAETRVVQPNDKILVRFTGVTDTGFDASFYDDEEKAFIVGQNEVTPALEMQVIGMALGEKKDFDIEPTPPSHPVPMRDEELVFEVPVEQLPPDGRSVGKTLLVGTESGQRPAMVTEIGGKMAKLDMNHPIAGKVLHMSVEILELDVDIDENAPVVINDPENVPDKEFTLDELAAFDGKDPNSDGTTLVAVNGFVYDVSGSVYGPGGSYEAFGGRDASLALAKYSMSPLLLNKPPVDLDRQAQKMLAYWVGTFSSKYKAIGRLAPY